VTYDVESLKTLKVAVAHPWLVEMRGGEKVFVELARMFPGADLFLLFGRLDRLPSDLQRRQIQTSFLQKTSPWRASYRGTLPLLPAAARSLDLRSYDLVITSSSGWIHGVRTDPAGVHVCYMHTPPRYLWDSSYTPRTRFGRLQRAALSSVKGRFQRWDRASAQKISKFLANSATVQRRIEASYSRGARVVYPPVDVARFIGSAHSKGGFALVVSELVAYKRVDCAIEACVQAGLELVVIGDGPERPGLEKLAARGRVTFLGRVPDPVVEQYLSKADVFIHAGIEDFGIATVEALAAGVPIVGINEGGTAEIVGQSDVGELVPVGSVDALVSALRRVIGREANEAVCRARALDFGPERFRSAVLASIGEALDDRKVAAAPAWNW